jgi:hypothetical protein
VTVIITGASDRSLQTVPSSVPDSPDGDDSNPYLGPMDEYGHLENLNPVERDTIFINASTSTSALTHYYNHIVIQNNATWTVKDSLYMHNLSKIIIRSGATLYVRNQAVIKDADIVLEAGGNIIVDENGRIKLSEKHTFVAPIGSTVDIKYGSIE